MEGNNGFGVIFLNGGLINLDSASISDLEKRKQEAMNLKNSAKIKLNKIADEIKIN